MKKVDTFMFIIIKNLHSSNDTIMKVKLGENIFSTIMINRGFISRIHRELQINKKKT